MKEKHRKKRSKIKKEENQATFYSYFLYVKVYNFS